MTRDRVAKDSASVVSKQLNSDSDPVNSEPVVSQMAKLRARISRFRHRFRGWPWLIPLLASGVTGMGAFLWLANLPPSPNCERLTLSDSERLYCADQATRKGKAEALSSALELTSNWSKSHPLYTQANRLEDEWSQSILVLARQRMDGGDLDQAVALARKVPQSSEAYREAQNLIDQWQLNWNQGEELVQTAQTAIKEQNWKRATEQVRLLVQLGDDYWQQRADEIVASMAAERKSFQTLKQAQSQANSSTTEDLVAAIQRVSQLNKNQLSQDAVDEKIEQWSQELLEIVQYYQNSGLYEQALAAAQGIPPDSPLSEQALALVQLTKAGTLAEADQLGSYVQALMVVRPLVAENQLLPDEGVAQVEEWEQQVQAFGQLQLAQLFAKIDQPFALKLAIDHAALIETEQPRRVESQTLIAMWQQQIETYGDRQLLVRAQQLAATNTVAGLSAAITAASQRDEPDQPLSAAALDWISKWEEDLERLQDQPILDQAMDLAKTGNLKAAIRTAERIGDDRFLYDDAQVAIAGWLSKVQTAEDRPILNAAEALAREGRLSEAIDKASQIAYGRTLYGEAQALIDEWSAELLPIVPAQPEVVYPSEEPEFEAEPVDPQPAPEPRSVYPPPQAAEPQPPPAVEPPPIVEPPPVDLAPTLEAPAAEPAPDAPAESVPEAPAVEVWPDV